MDTGVFSLLRGLISFGKLPGLISMRTWNVVPTTVWKGRSNRSPTESHLQIHTPIGLGRLSKNAFPPWYESPVGPWNRPHSPGELRTMANWRPAETEAGVVKMRLLKLTPPGA